MKTGPFVLPSYIYGYSAGTSNIVPQPRQVRVKEDASSSDGNTATNDVEGRIQTTTSCEGLAQDSWACRRDICGVVFDGRRVVSGAFSCLGARSGTRVSLFEPVIRRLRRLESRMEPAMARRMLWEVLMT